MQRLKSPALSSGVWSVLLASALLSTASCSGAPPSPSPGRGTLWGRVTLHPHEGVTPGSRELSVYGDRRLRDVEFVDYGRIGFAVVYLEEDRNPGGTLSVNVESAVLRGATLEPRTGVVGRGGRVLVRNADAKPHTVSCPREAWVRALGPGEEASVPMDQAGEADLFVLDLPEAACKVFVAPGSWSAVSGHGRWELRDLAPGPQALRVWHPRFPPERRAVVIRPDEATRVDVALSVESVRRGDPP